MLKIRLSQRIVALCAALWLLLLPGAAAAAAAGVPVAKPNVSAGAAILMDWQTGEILYERNARMRRAPASTTKVLTAIIVLEKAKLSDKVKVSKRAAYTVGSSMHIKPGEVYSVHDLLHGLLLRSGNDAAVALAEHVAGSVEAFAKLMNEKSRQIGARESNWNNPHGLTDPLHYSSAYDLAVITRYGLQNPTFAEIVAIRQKPLKYEHLNRDVVLHNTNRLLYELEGADGVKTGTTAAAGACLIASATRGDQKLISVVLAAGNRWQQSRTLLSWGFFNHRLVNFGQKGEVLAQAPVEDGKYRTVPLALGEDLLVVLRKDGEPPKLTPRWSANLTAPLAEGQQVGEVDLVVGEKVKRTVPLVVASAVPERSLLDAIYQMVAPLLRFVSDADMF